jgi:hypothetical protein
MSNTLTVTEVINSVTVTPVNNTVTVSDVGVQGPAGATGATGATGASGVVTVNAPLTNAGTSSAANLSVSTGTTSTVGVLQLTDSTSSTSTTTAATANAVKNTFDSIPSLTKRSGQYYRTPVGTLAFINPTTNRLLLSPIFIDQTVTLDRLAAITGSGFVGSASVRLGIYDNLNGRPNDLILDAGTASFTTNNTTQQITISQSVNRGFYWLAFCQQTTPTTSAFWGAGAGQSISNNYIYGAPTASGSLTLGYFQNSVTGALPSNVFTSASPFEITAYVWARFAS